MLTAAASDDALGHKHSLCSKEYFYSNLFIYLLNKYCYSLFIALNFKAN